MAHTTGAGLNQFSDQLQVVLKAGKFQKVTFCYGIPGLNRREMKGEDPFSFLFHFCVL